MTRNITGKEIKKIISDLQILQTNMYYDLPDHIALVLAENYRRLERARHAFDDIELLATIRYGDESADKILNVEDYNVPVELLEYTPSDESAIRDAHIPICVVDTILYFSNNVGGEQNDPLL